MNPMLMTADEAWKQAGQEADPRTRRLFEALAMALLALETTRSELELAQMVIDEADCCPLGDDLRPRRGFVT